MSNEEYIVAPMPGEPPLWYGRYTQFRMLGLARSVATVYQNEPSPKNDGKRRDPSGEWYQKARKWRWEERAAAWDAQQNSTYEQQLEAERQKVLTTRFALMHKRVQALDALATKLLAAASDDSKIWLKDVKAIGNGKDAKQVDLVIFNEGLIREIRGCLTDIAAEMGERVKKTELSAKVHNTGRVAVIVPQKYTLEEKEQVPDESDSTRPGE